MERNIINDELIKLINPHEKIKLIYSEDLYNDKIIDREWKQNSLNYIFSDCSDECLKLKRGMPLVITSNIDTLRGLTNGTQVRLLNYTDDYLEIYN